MEILRLYLDKNLNINCILNKWVLIIIIVLAIAYLIIRIREQPKGSFEIDKSEFGFGQQKITIKPNNEDLQIAYKLWVELSTRKIGLPIDFDHDVISEIYDSWYEFFSLTRELIKEIPVTKVRKNNSTNEIVNLAIDVLNEGLRPHLTKWQARFRHWYNVEIEKQKDFSPQELQRQFPHYTELITDMKIVNEKLIKYRLTMRQMYAELK